MYRASVKVTFGERAMASRRKQESGKRIDACRKKANTSEHLCISIAPPVTEDISPTVKSACSFEDPVDILLLCNFQITTSLKHPLSSCILPEDGVLSYQTPVSAQ